MTLKSLSMLQTKYCSTLIDVPEIIKSLKVSTQFSPSISQQLASSTLELPSNITDLLS
ncbi:18596_t:CDS:2 [Dentiscutata erythropus]|uniref:18596_t:CDS:1 n=1 Tax=Dentiscutata erythropus TaxID=1348616 RepID=A0A9N9C8V5_9GLOM|nr:18596_t:CDS:2 [Dentiscutata erythropus]